MATFRLCTDPPRSTHCTPYGLHVKLFPVKRCFTVASEDGIWNPGLSVTRRKASASATFLSNTFRGSSNTWHRQACVSSYINKGTLTLAHSTREHQKNPCKNDIRNIIHAILVVPCIATGSQIHSNFTENTSTLPVIIATWQIIIDPFVINTIGLSRPKIFYKSKLLIEE